MSSKLFTLLLILWTSTSCSSTVNYTDSTPIQSEYDFIIIGAGTAGSVIANRLSEVEDWSVLLLEAGEAPLEISEIPAQVTVLQRSEMNWGFHMEKQDNACLGLQDGLCPWPRGKALGGSSGINFMIYVRGNRRDFDRWEELGNDGWGYDDVLPYFKKMEDFLSEGDEGYHGFGGYQTITDVPYRSGAADAFVKAANESGFDVEDYNGEAQIGTANYIQGFLRNGSRCSTEMGYLRPAKDRSNLRISTGSRVTKVVVDPETKRATAVEFQKESQNYSVKANKEVILSAGSFQSPQLLMLSGVGPKEHLEEKGIEVLADSQSVGRNLMDHNSFYYTIYIVDEPITIKPNTNEALVEYNETKTGPLTSIGYAESVAFVRTDISTDPEDIPDVELLQFGITASNTTAGVTQEMYDTYLKPLQDKNAFMIFTMPLHSKSRGYVELTSDDPFAAPLLYGGMFTDHGNEDLRTFVAGIREIQRLMSAPAMQKYNAQLYNQSVPGCEGFDFDSDGYWECAVRRFATSIYHPVGTCKMGTDVDAVVDPQMMVYGVEGLRVVDASVIPVTLSGHTNGATLMLAEKAADLIKDYWLK